MSWLYGRRRRRDLGGGGGGDPLLPPDRQDLLVYAPPIDLSGGADTITSLVGPNARLGSAAGADTNDPTYVTDTFTFDANDYLVLLADDLDSTWTDPAGFTVIMLIAPNATDLAGADVAIFSKFANGSGDCAFIVRMVSGVLVVVTCYGNSTSDRDDYQDEGTPVAADVRVVLAYRFDPTEPRTTRGKWFVNGVPRTTSNPTSNGSDGVIAASSAEVRWCLRADAGSLTVVNQRPGYIYRGFVADEEITNNSDWCSDTLGWE